MSSFARFGVLAAFSSIVLLVPLQALEPRWAVSASVLVIPEDNGLESDPAPVLFAPGAAVSLPLVPFVSLEATADWYATYYGYSASLDRPVPYAIENRSAYVLGTILGFQVKADIPLPMDLGLRIYAGPAADLRLCLVADGLEGADQEDAASQTEDIAAYFWESGRWLLPVFGLGIDFPASDFFLIGLDLRAWYPAYTLWTSEDLPALEGWKAAAGLRFTLR